jgi:hypothetical protein
MPTDINSNLPPEIVLQQQGLNRQQEMAKLLLQQGAQQNMGPAGQMVSGHYVPNSFFQNLQGPVNQMLGAYLANKGDEKALALAEQIRKGRNEAEQKISDLTFGTPEVSSELAGPYAGNVPQPRAVSQEATKPDMVAALREINTNMYGAGKDIKPLIYKQMMPEPTPEEKRYKAAIADGSFKGGFNAFLNQMNDKDKASLALDRARYNLSAQQHAWEMGMPVGGVGGGGGAVAPQGQAPLRTINPGSPILAQGQQPVMPQGSMPQGQMPQVGMPQGQMPRFNSKAEQELWMAKQRKTNELQAEALSALPGAKLKVETALGAINNMIGDTTIDKEGNLKLGEKKPHAGFYESVGMPSPTNAFGFTGMFPGSDVQNFKSEFAKVGGSAFLQAVETMRGTGAISEVEGKKATDAITSMSLAQSEKAFVKAANEFKDAINKGYVASQQKAGVTPFNPTATPSTKAKLVYNPVTGTLE